MDSLKHRFGAFVRTTFGFEDIDRLSRGGRLPGRMKADYLLANRRFIIEQKSIEDDPIEKAQKFVEDVVHSRGIRAYGTVGIQEIFRKFADAAELNAALLARVTKSIEEKCAHADKQIRDTKLTF